MFRRGVGTMVLTERMQALGDHARSSNQRLIAERRHDRDQERDHDSRDEESLSQESRDQAISDQESRAPELFVTDNDTDAPAQTMMLEAPVLMPSPPQVSPAEDVIIESITTFLAVDERVPERAASKTGGGRAPEAAIAPSAGASASAQSPTHEGDDDLLAKRAILHEWQNWSALNSDELSDPNVAAYFIRHLEARKPKLLDFAAEDKMQVVRTWLLSEHCIKA
jgi:hypothetical protein